MAIQKPQLFSSITAAARGRFYPKAVRTKKFAAVGGAPLLAVGTPVAYDTSTSTWKAWANAGSNGVNTIRGFVWPDPIQLHATDEVIGVVFWRGEIHRDDVVLPGGETQNNLDTALKAPGMRAQGIDVEGLAGVS